MSTLSPSRAPLVSTPASQASQPLSICCRAAWLWKSRAYGSPLRFCARALGGLGCSGSPDLTCSPQFDPVTMRVQETQKITRRTLYGQGLLTRTDRPQAAPGRGQARHWLHHPAGGLRVRYQRGYLPSLETSLRHNELTGGQAAQGVREGECTPEEVGCRAGFGHRHPKGGEPGKLLSPAHRRKAVIHAQKTFRLSERRACQAIDQPRSTQRYSGKRA